MSFYRGMTCENVTISGDKGTPITAYVAKPSGPGPFPGVVLIHHLPGWSEFYIETTRRFAHHGYVAISTNLQFREGKATAEENSASVRAAGGMPDDRTMGDVQAAVDYVRGLPYSNGKVGVIGYCSGGRQAYLAGCTVRGIDAVISCYGGGVVAKPEELSPRQPKAPIDFTKDMQCPILCFFGIEDTRPSPADAAITEAELKKHGKVHECITYQNAGHAFFAVDRQQYRVQAALDGWKKVFEWYGKYLR